MRAVALVSAIAVSAALAGAAHAQDVTVTYGGDLDADRIEELGQRDVDRQAQALVSSVQDALRAKGGFDGARVELVLTDLEPNRPTFQQMADRPGLSMDSRYIGGAAIEGYLINADGERRPIKYDWYTASIRDVYGYTTWQDAGRAFDNFARRLADNRL